MKMMFFFAPLLILGLSSCKNSNFPDRFYDIQLENRSNSTIKAYLALGTEFVHPDTSIELNSPISGFRTIETNNSTYFDSRIQWKEIFETYLPDDTLSVFIFDVDTLDYYDWDTIRRYYKILRRYDLSLENLKQLDFKISYPPTAEMVGMKMYP